MIFNVVNEKADDYVSDYKPFQIKTIAVSANGYTNGVSELFLSMIDTGAKTTSISNKRMEKILANVLDKNDQKLQPIGTAKSRGIYGGWQETLLYCIPHLYLAQIHLTDVIVSVADTDNFDCLIGRSILHQCITTLNPKTDMMTFDFDDELRNSKQSILGYKVFNEIQLYSETAGE